jgi:demethylmacrocin O-methyltransferase
MKKLTEIGQKYGTYKATYHFFTEVYDDVFQQYESPRILEIGVAEYKSIAMYLEYFKNPYIVAMDIENKSHYVNEQWRFVQGDQTLISDLSKCVEEEELFDIVLEDGGHTMKQQQVTFGYLIDYIKPGGYYILEDLHTSFRNDYRETDCQFSSYEMLKNIEKKIVPFSNYIDRTQQEHLLSKIDTIDIFAKDPNDLWDSVTAIIKIK